MLTEHPDPGMDPRRRRRGRVLGVSTVLAGLLQLGLAAVLIGAPGTAPTLHPMPFPEGDEEHLTTRRPVVAASPRSTASPEQRDRRPDTVAAASPAAPAPPALPKTSKRTQRPAPAVSGHGPSKREAARVVPAGTPVVKRSQPVRRTRKTIVKPASSPTPSATPQVARGHVPPGQTRVPPGQEKKQAKKAEEPQTLTRVPPGQTKK